ncbi:MAG: hypothetical protein U5N55_01670 [Cypionkella sp.]|nr:hypothetical protein [Cypionkella sp.]
MMDMTPAIQPKSDQINADDLIGGPMTVTIEAVQIDPSADQKVSMRLHGMGKVYRPCKSMARVMVQAWGADASKYTGRSMTLYRDAKVKWGGMEVGGIRISHMTHIDGPMTMMLTMTKQNRAPFKVQVLHSTVAPPAPPAPENAEQLAREAASKGKAIFTEFWNSDTGKLCRDAIKPIMAELQSAATAADNSAAHVKDDDECPI